MAIFRPREIRTGSTAIAGGGRGRAGDAGRLTAVRGCATELTGGAEHPAAAAQRELRRRAVLLRDKAPPDRSLTCPAAFNASVADGHATPPSAVRRPPSASLSATAATPHSPDAPAAFTPSKRSVTPPCSNGKHPATAAQRELRRRAVLLRDKAPPDRSLTCPAAFNVSVASGNATPTSAASSTTAATPHSLDAPAAFTPSKRTQIKNRV